MSGAAQNSVATPGDRPSPRDLVVIGASAGGVEALRDLVAELPADLPAAVLVVLHRPAGGTSALAEILDRSGPLPAASAALSVPLTPGRILVAPPDHHLLVEDGTAVLSRGPTESGHRPSIDALFRSAARARGARVIAVVLSGALDDGAAGAVAVAGAGGIVAVQDPAESLFPGMPQAVSRLVEPDHVLSASELGRMLASRTGQPVEAKPRSTLSDLENREADIALRGEHSAGNDLAEFGRLAGFACPDCDGALLHLDGTERFRCRVGHAWTAEALATAQGERVERALWTAYRTLEERVEMAERMVAVARRHANPTMADRHAAIGREAADAVVTLRALLLDRPPLDATGPEGRTGPGG